MPELGFIGLGVMGGRITKRLMDAGYSVTGHNRTKSKAQWLLDDGMQWADSPRELTEKVDIVFSMVTNTEAVQAITSGDMGILAGLRPGKVYINMSTSSPAFSQELALQVKALGASMLDCPVSGSVSTIEEGQLSLMVSGEDKTFETVLPVLKAIGPKVTHVGDNGLAVVMKIATNLSLSVQMVALSEAVLMCEKCGIDRELALDILLKSVIASPMIAYRGPAILGMREDEEVWFNCNMMQKDMLLALELGRKLDVALPTTAITNELYSSTRGIGVDHYDMAAVFDVLALMAGAKSSIVQTASD
jgi:3-hydroxyisobutyrate dehydrogenase-like beta-hydroxyacid dehydrogenase